MYHYGNTQNATFPNLKELKIENRKKLPKKDEIDKLFACVEMPIPAKNENFILKSKIDNQMKYSCGAGSLIRSFTWDSAARIPNENCSHHLQEVKSERQRECNHWHSLASYLCDRSSSRERAIQQLEDQIVNTIREAGFFRQTCIREFEKEIRVRKQQYPEQTLIVFIGEAISNYIDTIFEGKMLDQVVYLVLSSPYYSYSSNKNDPQDRRCHPWEHAVVAPSQVKVFSTYAQSWTKEKIPRYWRINEEFTYNFNVLVEKRVGTEAKLYTAPKQILGRVQNLEIE